MRDLTDPAEVKAGSVRGLCWGLQNLRPNLEIDCYGNVGPFDENLPPYMENVCWAGEIGHWMDFELDEYMRSVRSSPALAVNCFGPLMMAGLAFSLGDHRKLYVHGFERRSRNSFGEEREPHLDVLAYGPHGLVAIDPTCIDYLAPRRSRMPEKNEGLSSETATDSWTAELLRIRKGEQSYRWLDAEHLIERALSLGRYNSDQPSTLAYIYWEPMDEGLSPLFEEHRQEVAAFAARVAGGSVRFEAVSWFDLWNDWAETGDPLLQLQVAELRARYEVPAWAWEGVEWRDGRLRSASWLDGLLDNPEADRAVAEDTIKRAMAEYGWSEAEARKLFGS